MTVTDRHSDCGDPDQFANPACERDPWFDLDWEVDDPDAPSELTIVAAEGTPGEWISIDPAHAVALSALR